ncbi:glutamate--cysteine ligase [Corynebacterium canis]|uniref:Putative glutamate--cysteine ligase 2 n=1 Tax=Corynebacterium canis TaxID=679663 RepID=A0A5C5UEV2_9CORY|nr:glutamate--cysteine ligase [Corynebacterium canis]TWT24518.1 glutamate--cysteine ligase [Corynebacterium canis]WJY76300.1 Carboxylate-amine ligase YbdK [Corynebacterium canis]
MLQPFQGSPKPTLGIEWEVALVDPVTRDLTPRAAAVIERANKNHPEIHLEREFLQNTVELITGVHTNVPDAVAELRSGLAAVIEAAHAEGVRVWSSGGHPFSDWRDQPVSDKGIYQEIIKRTQYWGRQMLIWGIHVHVGISDADRVWPIINALMTHYPHLLVLSASSPAWNGLDTGYASNRTMLYQQLPTAGMPFGFVDWEQWSEYMSDQAISGVINHTGAMHFDIRPAGKWGTIEVRVADATSTLRELAAVVALTHCLVVYYDRLYDTGQQLPSLQPWHLAENKWRAARYGLDAEIIVSRQTDEVLVRDDLLRMARLLEPLAKELGCDNELATIPELIEQGAAYQRQRKLYEETGSWQAVVDATCDEVESLK